MQAQGDLHSDNVNASAGWHNDVLNECAAGIAVSDLWSTSYYLRTRRIETGGPRGNIGFVQVVVYVHDIVFPLLVYVGVSFML